MLKQLQGHLVAAYNHYAVFYRLNWKKPIYQRAYSIKKLPLEANIDLIISYTKTKDRVAFRLVKECGLRPVEVSHLTLKQIDRALPVPLNSQYQLG